MNRCVRHVVVICVMFISLSSCYNSSRTIQSNRRDIDYKQPIASIGVPELIVSDSSFIAILDELISFVEVHIPEYKKYKESIYFDFKANMQNNGILYNVSFEGSKDFIIMSSETTPHNVRGAFYYKNILFIIRKNMTGSDMPPFSTNNEKVILNYTHSGFIAIYEIGDIKQKGNKYELNVDFHKYVPRIR